MRQNHPCAVCHRPIQEGERHITASRAACHIPCHQKDARTAEVAMDEYDGCCFARKIIELLFSGQYVLSKHDFVPVGEMWVKSDGEIVKHKGYAGLRDITRGNGSATP